MSFLGLDWDALYANAEASVKNASSDLVAVGVPAIKAGLEQQAIDWLKGQQADTQKQLKDNLGAVLDRPSDPNSLGGIISGFTTNAAVSHYAPLILIGVGGLLLVGMYLRK